MPEISDLPTWLSLSSSLLQARPTTTRITSKYTVLSSAKSRKRIKKDGKGDTEESTAKSENESTASKRRATFTIKTHDTVSGSTLVYKTTKASDLGMVMRNLGGLSSDMAGVARSVVTTGTSDTAMVEAGEEEETSALAAPSAAAAAEGGESTGKSKKKKKGKGKR